MCFCDSPDGDTLLALQVCFIMTSVKEKNSSNRCITRLYWPADLALRLGLSVGSALAVLMRHEGLDAYNQKLAFER